MNKLSQAAVQQRLENAGVVQKLQRMMDDGTLNTVTTSYSANALLYPDHAMPFIDKHVAYLLGHPSVDIEHYLANLRLMLKKR